MSNPVKCILLGCTAVAVIAMTLVGDPQPAKAQFGISFGGIRFNIHPGYGYRYGRRHRRGGKSGEEDSSKSAEETTKRGKDEKVVPSKGAPNVKEQTVALKSVMVTAVVRDVGSTKDLNEVGQQKTKSQD